ncbi:MAG: PhzF family phenazine biosynthesis protein [Syntrophobacteraceae bacterium]|nr:PhzF family phenazine biosynthesis protein [Syntrophobacteraceae bacterium]
MRVPIYQVDAFTSEVFSGNPAAVCLLTEWLPDSTLQAIAAENNLSETAFIVQAGEDFELRWFTPLTEVALCGHATLAAACVLFEMRRWPGKAIGFKTRKSGKLMVENKGGLFEMDFPSRPPNGEMHSGGFAEMLGAPPVKVMSSQEDIFVVFDTEKAVRELKPDLSALAGLDCRGTIVTARGERSDFVSRFFAPAVGVDEDPVCGSAHCVLTPYWAEILGKKDLRALQVSSRGGEIFCRDRGERVSIAGRCALYLEGVISI